MKKKIGFVLLVLLFWFAISYLGAECWCYESPSDDGFQVMKRYEVIQDMLHGKRYAFVYVNGVETSLSCYEYPY